MRIIWVGERKHTQSYIVEDYLGGRERKYTQSYIVEDYLGRREKTHTVLYN